MPYFKDPTGGLHFLDDAAFAYLLPDGSVRITDEEAADLQVPRNSKSDKWHEIKAERDRRQLNGGVRVGQHWYLSTERATSEYNTIVNTTRDVPDNTIIRAGWRTMDGAEVNMTPALALQILTAGIAQSCAIDDAAKAHKALMEASADPASYDFSGGWPAIFEG